MNLKTNFKILNMNKLSIIVLLSFAFINRLPAQQITSPLEKNNYQKVTSYEELSAFIKQLDEKSDLLTVETIGKSAKGHNVYVLKFSSSVFGKDKSKIKILVHAQQHGNEQSGKEAALMLAQALLKPENRYLFDKIDFAVVPQMNPDGSELNQRRNGNDMDLNRNHMIFTEPESQALHRFFDKYLFEVTMDVHEYFPYGGDWEKYGYRRNADETLGVNTNPNVSEQIRDLSNNEVFPYWAKYLADNKFRTAIYSPGGPPEIDYIRHSTFDVNDGRQSFGIQNTLSFIQEGLNGEDNFVANIRHRAEGQMTGMRAILEFSYLHKDEIKKMVADSRTALISGKANPKVSIQSEHAANGQKLFMTLLSYSTKKDTVVVVNDYRPVVKSVTDVDKPAGYLIPKKVKELVEWAGKQALTTTAYKVNHGQKIEQYFIKSMDSIDFERDIIINPIVETKEFTGKINPDDYIFIPTAQLKGNMIVLALEPKSELGLVTYRQFAHLLKVGETFPVLKVEKK
jgi:hypothetical protein